MKPKCELIGKNGNVFNLVSIARRTLERNGQKKQGQEMFSKVMASGSYDEALSIIGQYVEIE